MIGPNTTGQRLLFSPVGVPVTLKLEAFDCVRLSMWGLSFQHSLRECVF